MSEVIEFEDAETLVVGDVVVSIEREEIPGATHTPVETGDFTDNVTSADFGGADLIDHMADSAAFDAFPASNVSIIAPGNFQPAQRRAA